MRSLPSATGLPRAASFSRLLDCSFPWPLLTWSPADRTPLLLGCRARYGPGGASDPGALTSARDSLQPTPVSASVRAVRRGTWLTGHRSHAGASWHLADTPDAKIPQRCRAAWAEDLSTTIYPRQRTANDPSPFTVHDRPDAWHGLNPHTTPTSIAMQTSMRPQRSFLPSHLCQSNAPAKLRRACAATHPPRASRAPPASAGC